MKIPLVFLALVFSMNLSAAERRVEIQWTFVSAEKPVLENLKIFPKSELENALMLGGVLREPQLRVALEKARRESATVTSLPAQIVAPGKRAETKSLREIPLEEFAGDARGPIARQYRAKWERQAGTTSIGYDLVCRPTIGADGETIDLAAEIKLGAIKGYTETLLTGGLAAALADQPSKVAPQDAPRVRQPILQRLGVTTNMTTYDGNSLIFARTQSPTSPSYDYVILSARLVDAK